MKPGELMLVSVGAIIAGAIIAFSPFINILFGWWLTPLLVLGGIASLFGGIVFGLWEIVRILIRFIICQVFREEEEGRPTFHRFHLNGKIWQLLGGGHCGSLVS